MYAPPKGELHVSHFRMLQKFKVPDFEEKKPYVIVRAPPVVRFLKKTFAITKYNILFKPVRGSPPPLISYLSMKEGSLFCSYEIHQTGMLQVMFLVSLKRRRGALAWFHEVWTCGAKVLEYWMITSLKIKLNRSWKFRRNWNVPLVLLERSWWAGFNGIYLVRFGFRMCARYWFWSDFCRWKFK